MDKYIDIKLFLQLHHTANFTLDSFDILLLCNPAISNHLYIISGDYNTRQKQQMTKLPD
jgi:hypothetical protein